MAEGLRPDDGHKTYGVHVVSLDGGEHVAPFTVATPSPGGVAPSGLGFVNHHSKAAFCPSKAMLVGIVQVTIY